MLPLDLSVQRKPLMARMFTAAIGVAALAWAVVTVPLFRAQAAVAQIGSRILAGEAYNSDVLDDAAARLDEDTAALRPANLRMAAAIRLRRAQDAMRQKDSELVDKRLKSLEGAIDASLANAPVDPFLWTVRFWVENTRGGFSADHLRILQISYSLGPNEAWIALRRNPLALALYPSLSPELERAAISEFVGLVRSQLYDEAASILAGPGWPIRHALMAPLRELKEAKRRAFARVIYYREEEALEDIVVPGIQMGPKHPWEHH